MMQPSVSKSLSTHRGASVRQVGRPVRNSQTPRRNVAVQVAAAPSFLVDVDQAPPDPILGVTEAWRADSNPEKMNLGVGAYRDEDGNPLVLDVVKEAEKRMLAKGENKEYLPIDGLASFRAATIELLLGADAADKFGGRIACCQSLSGTGSLRVGAAFLSRFKPGAVVYLSDPTWGNHKNIFADSGCPVATYRYFDPTSIGLDFDGMIADLSAAPAGSVVVLHGCAHNPTGVDPTMEQWSKIADVCKEKGLFPFFDVAYQGFASGSLEEDAASVRLFADRDIEFMVSQSYSKNLGLYGERIGAISAFLSSEDVAKRALSQIKRVARAMYSNPPVHGARIVSEVVSDPELFAQWKAEMEGMSGRIKEVRTELQSELEKLDSSRDWSFVTRQIGMFSFTGLTKPQVENMWDKHSVFMTKDGRISLAGLSKAKCPRLAAAMIDSYTV